GIRAGGPRRAPGPSKNDSVREAGLGEGIETCGGPRREQITTSGVQVWGHEHMLYSGGGWVNSTHVQAFTASARSMLGPRNGKASQERRLLLTERGRNSSWGRWIDNFAAVRLEAERWAAGSGVVDRVEVSDFAQLPLAEQLGQAAGLRILFGAHGDGLTWGAFMEPGGAVLEVVPARRQGFQVCEEGANRNPRGIFGGVARLAGQAHVCFVSPESKVLPFESFEKDAWQWGCPRRPPRELRRGGGAAVQA
ncbi:unnamed protein product, partial [Prorocentrum cordatum]